MRIVHDEGVFEGRVMFANLANLPRFGGGMQIAPQAKIDDGMLDLVIVKEISRRTLLASSPRSTRASTWGTRRACSTAPGGWRSRSTGR